MRQRMLRVLTAFKMHWINIRLWKPFIRATKNPNKIQTRLLLKIIRNNKLTTFGKENRFESISNYEDYRKHVSVMSYESLEPYIKQQALENKAHLCSEQPVMYAKTSGSSSSPKLIPINKRTIEQYRLSQHLVAYAIYLLTPDAYKGKILAIVSPSTEGVTDSGVPYGSMSGLIYKSMPKLTRSKYVLPRSVFEIEDYDRKYYVIALNALLEANITMISTANPSTLVKLTHVIFNHTESLITDITKQNPVRANQLQLLFNRDEDPLLTDIWPKLNVITVWTGGSCGTQLPNIKNIISPSVKIVELGYLSSEFRGGITVDANANLQIPAIHENFYEFVEKQDWEKHDWEQQRHNFKTISEITVGKQYYIFATTQSGLYRYNINDIIEITGKFNNTPTIRFIQKGSGVINLTGEKLYESQVVDAVVNTLGASDTTVPFFIMLGCPETLTYSLYIESSEVDVKKIERHLGEQNIEFKDKLASGRLKPINVVYIKPNTGEVYKQHCLRGGQREGQFKLNHLQNKSDCSFHFDNYKESSVCNS